MRPAQTDERIEADIDAIVAELLGEDETPTTQAIVRTETPTDTGTPVESATGSAGGFLGGAIGLLIWPLMIALAAGGAYLIYKFVMAGPAKSSSRAKSKKIDQRKRKTAKKSSASTQIPSGNPQEPQQATVPTRPPLPYEVEQWLEKALLADKRGDFREAVRCRYRALIALLAHRKLVDETETTTVGEYLLEVHASTPSNLRTFASAAGIFELAWYTDRSLESEQSQDMERLFDVMAEATR